MQKGHYRVNAAKLAQRMEEGELGCPGVEEGNLPLGFLASGGAFPFQSKLSYKWGS